MLGLLLGLFGAGLYASERLDDELANATDRRRASEPASSSCFPTLRASLAPEFLWTGAGRGAFEVAYPRHSPEPRTETFTHPENALLQWATEFGLPACCCF